MSDKPRVKIPQSKPQVRTTAPMTTSAPRVRVPQVTPVSQAQLRAARQRAAEEAMARKVALQLAQQIPVETKTMYAEELVESLEQQLPIRQVRGGLPTGITSLMERALSTPLPEESKEREDTSSEEEEIERLYRPSTKMSRRAPRAPRILEIQDVRRGLEQAGNMRLSKAAMLLFKEERHKFSIAQGLAIVKIAIEVAADCKKRTISEAHMATAIKAFSICDTLEGRREQDTRRGETLAKQRESRKRDIYAAQGGTGGMKGYRASLGQARAPLSTGPLSLTKKNAPMMLAKYIKLYDNEVNVYGPGQRATVYAQRIDDVLRFMETSGGGSNWSIMGGFDAISPTTKANIRVGKEIIDRGSRR